MSQLSESMKRGMTVLIPTYNRAEVLEATLEALVGIDRSGIECAFVVIDNNSTDRTAEVVRRYFGRLPITLLSEPQPGKNCALNRALREIELRDLVVFIDDDVTPANDWLQEIVAASARWPNVAVFGGAVEVLWPDGKAPEWAEADWIKAFGFSWHRYAEAEVFYEPPACPFGPNFWVRSRVFEVEPWFDETIGPRPVNRIMGSETAFLRRLQEKGLAALHVPTCVVQHRIRRSECAIAALQRRAYTFGRGQARLHGFRRHTLFLRNRQLWVLAIAADYVHACVRLCIGLLRQDLRKRCELTATAMMRLGHLRETVSGLTGPSRRSAEAACSREAGRSPAS
jgi:glycosyltransferase involved in cell wall biosynthesis